MSEMTYEEVQSEIKALDNLLEQSKDEGADATESFVAAVLVSEGSNIIERMSNFFTNVIAAAEEARPVIERRAELRKKHKEYVELLETLEPSNTPAAAE